jgi:cell division protein FtsQ
VTSRRTRRKAAFLVVIAVVVIAGAAWALLGGGLLVVRSVQVTGVSAVPRAEVLRAAGIRYGTPLIRVDTARVAQQVEQLTQVQSAQVSRDWPDTIVISVRARTAVLALASGGGFALVDRFGVVLRTATWRHGLPLLQPVPAGRLRDSAVIATAATVLRELPARLRRRVAEVHVPGADQVRLGLRGGITIVWGGPSRAAAKAAELRILMRQQARYYNVSDPDTAVTAG